MLSISTARVVASALMEPFDDIMLHLKKIPFLHEVSTAPDEVQTMPIVEALKLRERNLVSINQKVRTGNS